MYFFSINDDSGLVYRCRSIQPLRRNSVTVLGCISVEGPREIYKVSPGMNVRNYIEHLTNLYTILRAWEPIEGEFLGWRFAHPHEPITSSMAVQYWFQSQSKIQCIPWPHSAEELFPMKKVWLKLEEELNYQIFSGITVVDLWTHIKQVWPLITNAIQSTIFDIPFCCSDYVEAQDIVE